MILRIFFLFVGFGFAVAGGVTLIVFLNLLATGHDFGGYLSFLTGRFETYLFLGGLFIMWLSIYFPSRQ